MHLRLFEFCFIIIYNKLYLVLSEVMCDGQLYGSRCCIKAWVLVLGTRGRVYGLAPQWCKCQHYVSLQDGRGVKYRASMPDTACSPIFIRRRPNMNIHIG